MRRLTIRISDEQHERLRGLAAYRNLSLNQLLDELSTVILAEFDTETRL